MRVFAFNLEEETKCPECNWETNRVYVLARNKKLAEMLFKEGDFLCGNCLADKLVGESEALEDMVVAYAKYFDPDDYDIAVPNWLTREDAEKYLGKELTDEEWEDLKEWVMDELMDEVMDRIWESVDNWEANR